MEYERKALPLLRAHLSEAPVTWIRGARQVGKSSLALKATAEGRLYQTLDDDVTMNLATSDPQGYILSLPERVTIDEVQRAPQLFQAIKLSVDRNRKPGRFLLTGSANVFALPKANESLAGRMHILDLEPLAQVEIEGNPGRFIDRCFTQDWSVSHVGSALTRQQIWQRVIRGGYPEAVKSSSVMSRERLFQGYVYSLVSRDVKEIAQISRLDQLPNLLSILASRSSNLLNKTDIGRSISIPNTTIDRYLSLLEALFIYKPLNAYHADAAIGLAKASKVQLVDSGIAAYLTNLNDEDFNHRSYGSFLESFVVNEVRRLATWQSRPPHIQHFRDKRGVEVDIVIDGHRRGVVGIEVKGKFSVKSEDFRGLDKLREVVGQRWAVGILLYQGEQIYKVGHHWAIPIQALWEW